MPLPKTYFRDRETGDLIEEPVFSQKSLFFLYHNPIGRFISSCFLRFHWVSKLYGRQAKSPKSRKKIAGFVQRLGINLEEAIRPLADYQSLDDFFTRKLKPEARPIDPNPKHLITPADGRVLVYPKLEEHKLSVKGSEVEVSELLQDQHLTTQFQNGSALVVRLAPADYHRFHFPDAGEAKPARDLGWGLYSVHSIALSAGTKSFLNHRHISILKSQNFGSICIIEVGALFVGCIEQSYLPGNVERGQEKGLFHFGGSTVILLFEPERILFDQDLIEASSQGIESYVRLGTRIGVQL